MSSRVFCKSVFLSINRQNRRQRKKQHWAETNWPNSAQEATAQIGPTGRRGSRAVGRRIWANEEAGRLSWRWASRSGEGDTGQRAKQRDEWSRQRRGQHESLASELLLVTEEQRQQQVPDDGGWARWTSAMWAQGTEGVRRDGVYRRRTAARIHQI